MHGGARHPEANRRRAATEDARRACQTYGLPINVSPENALQQELARSQGHVVWLGELLADMGAGELVQRVTRESSSGASDLRDFDMSRVEQAVGPWLEVYMRERAHLRDVAATCLRTGLETRLTALAEGTAGQIIATLEGALRTLGIDMSEERVRAAVGAQLAIVSAQPTPAAVYRKDATSWRPAS